MKQPHLAFGSAAKALPRLTETAVWGLSLAMAMAMASGAAAAGGVEVDDGPPTSTPLADVFVAEVDRRLAPGAQEVIEWRGLLQRAFAVAGVAVPDGQFVLMVDRAPHAQAAVLWWLPPQGGFDAARVVGASPVSTGRASGYDHFETPLGVFPHTLANPDFRAEGTPNAQGICGYGARGMRVFDFGWQRGWRGWGGGGWGQMRLQVHATDPQRLEPRLGTQQSKGCIRIAASLNRFLDRHGVLDADYDAAVARGESFWVLRSDRLMTPWAGRWLVVVDREGSGH